MLFYLLSCIARCFFVLSRVIPLPFFRDVSYSLSGPAQCRCPCFFEHHPAATRYRSPCKQYILSALFSRGEGCAHQGYEFAPGPKACRFRADGVSIPLCFLLALRPLRFQKLFVRACVSPPHREQHGRTRAHPFCPTLYHTGGR